MRLPLSILVSSRNRQHAIASSSLQPRDAGPFHRSMCGSAAAARSLSRCDSAIPEARVIRILCFVAASDETAFVGLE